VEKKIETKQKQGHKSRGAMKVLEGREGGG
jgi:hypothetical protein